ncbi:uncharacterized protein LOC124929780 [Impatiens glandulifera]|uniref:uncharacterized protein LOC124929780 n=1 Tax=Impatiens glandulifera TaxID=253017 RepID=UPI001FB0E254|nr:uncharacterized protein LOC124929780 [Impatiens glandulifera]
MDNLLNEIERSNAIYNLSGVDADQNHKNELESDESECDEIHNAEQDYSTDNDDEHIPTAPWFETEEINVNSGNCSNIGPLDYNLFESQSFTNKQSAISAIKEYHIRSSRNFHVVKSDTTRYEASCVMKDCPWRIRVMRSKKSGLFVTTKLPAEHTCVLMTLERDHKKLTSRMIADVIKLQVIDSPYLKVSNIRNQITSMYNYHVSYKKALIGKQKAISDVYGDWMTSYAKLPIFFSALIHFNPGTIAFIDAEAHSTKPNTSVCKRIWWGFKPMIDGWQHAPPVISIDGTFLKGKYNGKLLIAMGSDSNNQQYPIAYALVHEETTVNWSWFLHHLRLYVCQNRKGVCIISDRHAGIIEAMKMVESGFTAFPGAHLKMLCWMAGSTSQVRKFEAAMTQIKEINLDAEIWLRKIPLEMWTMSHDGGYRYGQATTNMVESFNGLLRSARYLPVTSMIEYTYYRSVKLVSQRRTATFNDLQNGQTYCQRSRELFETVEKKASSHKVIPYNEQRGVFEIVTAQYRTINGYWKGGCLTCNLDWKQYIESYHNLSSLCEMWKYEFNPILNQAYWTFPLANNWEMYGVLIADEDMKKKKNLV